MRIGVGRRPRARAPRRPCVCRARRAAPNARKRSNCSGRWNSHPDRSWRLAQRRASPGTPRDATRRRLGHRPGFLSSAAGARPDPVRGWARSRCRPRSPPEAVERLHAWSTSGRLPTRSRRGRPCRPPSTGGGTSRDRGPSAAPSTPRARVLKAFLESRLRGARRRGWQPSARALLRTLAAPSTLPFSQPFAGARVDLHRVHARTPGTPSFFARPTRQHRCTAATLNERWTLADTKAWVRSHPNWSPRTTQKFLTCLRTFTRCARETGLDVLDLAAQISALDAAPSNRLESRPSQALVDESSWRTSAHWDMRINSGPPWMGRPLAAARQIPPESQLGTPGGGPFTLPRGPP